MTTSSIAASNVRAGVGGAKPREGAGAEGQGFSAVLSLRLGMGLNAAMGVAQIVPPPAQKPTAETEPAQGRAPATRDAELNESDQAEPEETTVFDRAGHVEEADEGAEPANPGIVPESRVPNDVSSVEPSKSKPDAVQPEQDPARAGTSNAAVLPPPVHAQVAHAKAASVVQESQPSTSEPVASVTETAGEPDVQTVKNESGRRSSTGSGRRVMARAATEEAAAEPAGAARDPLGLIRDRLPAVETASNPAAIDPERHAKADVAADVFGVRVGQVEPARARFADSVEGASATRAASSGAVPVTNAPPVPQGFAQATASRPAMVGVSGVGSTGGSGVGGAGVGGGGGGAASDFGGLFNSGGRAFGVAFGAAVRSGKGAVVVPGAGSTKGDSKEQIQAQISRGLAAALRQKGGVMSLRLNPEHLGSMKIDLTIENGRVTAVFDAQSEQARQILREGVDGLKRSIEQTGLVVKSIEVVGVSSVSAQEASRQGEGSFEGKPGQHNGDQGGGSHRHNGEQQGGNEKALALDELEAIGAADAGGVWAEADGSASGLLRLRVDAVV